MTELFDQLRLLKAELVVISDDSTLLQGAQLPLRITSGLPEWLSPLVAVIPGQLFALNLALARGLDPDAPAGLHKVTETL